MLGWREAYRHSSCCLLYPTIRNHRFAIVPLWCNWHASVFALLVTKTPHTTEQGICSNLHDRHDKLDKVFCKQHGGSIRTYVITLAITNQARVVAQTGPIPSRLHRLVGRTNRQSCSRYRQKRQRSCACRMFRLDCIPSFLVTTPWIRRCPRIWSRGDQRTKGSGLSLAVGDSLYVISP